MNILTLNSIAKLFALAANRQAKESINKFVAVFKSFLNSEIEDKYISDYTEIYKNYLKEYSSESSQKRISLNSVKLIRICEEIKLNISISERLIVVYFLIILIKETGCGQLSEEFSSLIANIFGFSDDFYYELKRFIFSDNKTEYTSVFVDNVNIAEIFLTDFEVIFIKSLSVKLKLNDKKIIEGQVKYFLKDSVLVYNDIKKLFYPDLKSLSKGPINETEKKFYLNIRDIELKKNKRIILHKTSLDFCSGELIAVIGKSGSGKTSFLRSISGLENKASGEVYFTGILSGKDILIKSYLPQHDNFIPFYTVEEHLQHRCNFLQMSSESSKIKINEVFSETGLLEESNKIVCKADRSSYQLSGGQQKRLGIAMELLNQPEVLVLDEPTSGLSSEDTFKIVSLLRSIANQNKIIVASVHQPDFDIFMMFDKILIIDDGGYPIYYGSPAKSVEYFREILGKVDKNSLIETRFNPGVLLKMIEEKQFDENGSATRKRKFSASEYYQRFVNANQFNKKDEKINFVKRVRQNNWLSFINHLEFSISVEIKQKSRLVLLLLIPLLSGVLFSTLLKYSNTEDYIYYYNPNVPVWILVILTTAIFTGLVNSGHEFIFLRHFNQHENRIIDKSHSYLLSIVFKYIILSLIQALLLVLPSVLIIENSFHFLTLFFISFLLICWGSMVSLLISGFCRQISTVYLAIPLIMIPQLIFSGAMINFGDFNKIINDKGRVPLIADIIPMRWASEAVITDFYCNNPYYKDIYKYRQFVNNSVYYLDYFIPQLEEIGKTDKERAERIVISEINNVGFVGSIENAKLDLNVQKNFYNNQKNKYLLFEDSVINTKSELNLLKLKYSNEAVNKVINNPNSPPFIILNDKILRNFKSVYSFPGTEGLNRCFFKSYGKFGNVELVSFVYNSVILCIYIVLLIFLIFIIKNLKI
ncbi:MAG TPA: ATP-binding cassette domain-containing protein [Bacteroidales bacterium]|nr:ATP-binding cassette domain-containing protein [Bacteroidales bacterium]